MAWLESLTYRCGFRISFFFFFLKLQNSDMFAIIWYEDQYNDFQRGLDSITPALANYLPFWPYLYNPDVIFLIFNFFGKGKAGSVKLSLLSFNGGGSWLMKGVWVHSHFLIWCFPTSEHPFLKTSSNSSCYPTQPLLKLQSLLNKYIYIKQIWSNPCSCIYLLKMLTTKEKKKRKKNQGIWKQSLHVFYPQDSFINNKNNNKRDIKKKGGDR